MTKKKERTLFPLVLLRKQEKYAGESASQPRVLNEWEFLMRISAVICLMAALLLGPAASAAEAVVQTRKLPAQEWSNKTVKLGEGVVFKLNDYIRASSIRSRPDTKQLFDPGFRNNFLTKDAEYTEDVEEAEDRVVVTRTLVLHMKDPCAPGIENGGFSFCFKPKAGKPINQETKKYLDGVREKINQGLRKLPSDPEAVKVRHYLNMSDAQLLDQLLNKADNAKTKKIIHRSVVPYIAYEFRKAPDVDLFDLRAPLPRTNQFMFKPTHGQSVSANIPDVSNAARFPARPSLASFSPDRGKHEDTITISGTNLDSVMSVELFDDKGEFPLTVVSRSSDKIAAVVEGWAGPKKVRLRWAGGTVESSQTFGIYFEGMKAAPPARGHGPNGEYSFEDTKTTTATAKYLTGFTFSKNYGDDYYVHIADETWLTDKYYAKFSWDLGVGFGLRWPFEVTATSTINRVYGPRNTANPTTYPYPARSPEQLCSGLSEEGGISIEGEGANRNAHLCAQAAEVKVRTTEHGKAYFDEEFYRSTGLPNDKLFKGRELVFEMGLRCRFYASIPGPNISTSCPRSWYFEPLVEYSQFTPQLGSTPKDFVKVEIPGRTIGLALDLGLGYVAFNPGVALQGHSGKFTLDIRGHRSTPSSTSVKLVGFNKDEKIDVVEKTAENGRGGNWGIDLLNPSYSVTAALAPTMSVEVGIDLGVYEWIERFGPVTFDNLAVDIGTGKFERHEGTKGTYEMRNIGTRPTIPPKPKTTKSASR